MSITKHLKEPSELEENAVLCGACVSLRANKPIRHGQALPSVGGFEMKFGTKKMMFDFLESEYCIDEESNTIRCFLTKLDIYSFPEAGKSKSKSLISNVTEIIEIYIDKEGMPENGENDEFTIVEVTIQAKTLGDSNNFTFEDYSISQKVIDDYNKAVKEN